MSEERVYLATANAAGEVTLPPSVVSNSAEIDLCRAPYSVLPELTDVTTAINEAMATLEAAGGGQIFFSKPGTYLIHGAIKEGEAFTGKYAGQILFPARSFTESPGVAITIAGCIPATAGDPNPVGAVTLLTNATTGAMFDGIPGDDTAMGRPATNILARFENLRVLCPKNPQCEAINLKNLGRCDLENVQLGVQAFSETEALTGTGAALRLPITSCAGYCNLTNVGITGGFPVGVVISEHGVFHNLHIEYCGVGIESVAGGHANYFSYVDIEGCPIALKNGGTCRIEGFLDWQGTTRANPYKSTLFLDDPSNAFVGHLNVYLGSPGAAKQGVPQIGGTHLDLTDISISGVSWRAQYPADNFLRHYTDNAGEPGRCSLSCTPWLVETGAFANTQASEYGELRSTVALGSSEALLPLPYTPPGGASRVARFTLALAENEYWFRHVIGKPFGGPVNGELRVQFRHDHTTITFTNTEGTTTLAEVEPLAKNAIHKIAVPVEYNPQGNPTTVRVIMDGTEVAKATLTVEQQEACKPGTDPYTPLLTGVYFNNDTESALRSFEVVPLGEPGGVGAKGAEGKEGATAPATNGVLVPVGCTLIPGHTTPMSTAFRAHFRRYIVPTTGHVKAVHAPNGATVAGSFRMAIFDVGEANAGKYTVLWEGAETAMAGASVYQSGGAPELAVSVNQEILIALMSNSTTATYGSEGLAAEGYAELPTEYMPVAGGAKPKLQGTHTFASLSFGGVGATITEAQLGLFASVAVPIGRVA